MLEIYAWTYGNQWACLSMHRQSPLARSWTLLWSGRSMALRTATLCLSPSVVEWDSRLALGLPRLPPFWEDAQVAASPPLGPPSAALVSMGSTIRRRLRFADEQGAFALPILSFITFSNNFKTFSGHWMPMHRPSDERLSSSSSSVVRRCSARERWVRLGQDSESIYSINCRLQVKPRLFLGFCINFT